MDDDVTDAGDRHGLDPGAARAVSLAESEANQLGHDRVGTEHLLLGLLTNESVASTMLSDAGVTLAAARNKVTEAVGPSSQGQPQSRRGSLPQTARAARAVARSRRFAHARGSDVVTSQHVLTGVLDVEGIAGQVLRGLGIDVEALRAALDAFVEESPSDNDGPARPPHLVFRRPTCPSCDAPLDEDLVHRVVPAGDEHGNTRDALIFACGACGRVLGVGPA
ncbi:MAG: Clp protease N-terminal domain-containing protein [Acidimicrobiales bacterium]